MSVTDEVTEDLEEPPMEDTLPIPPFPRADVTRGMESLDDIDLLSVFARRVVVMRTVPAFLKDGFRDALRMSMDEIIADNECTMIREWIGRGIS